MKRRFICSLLFTFAVCVLSYLALANLLTSLTDSVAAAPHQLTQGALQITSQDGQRAGQCPLKHTAVKTEISGGLARTVVTQEFQNPLSEKIEAVYVFPLPQNAAVDDLTLLVGARTIKGRIKRRAEARAIYEAAREAGHHVALLDQERPNIFTQAVANITPGALVKVTISYVEMLKYEDGQYEYVFPMVVGPRYVPGQATGQANAGSGWAPDTSQVPDASRITPPVTSAATRAGHDIAIEVQLDAGVPLDGLQATRHEVEVERPNQHAALVRLKNRATIPNKDFILKFDVAGKRVSDAVLAHRGGQGGFFSLIVQPPERVVASEVTPKEIVFVLDTSGSMNGFPIEKAKEAMRLALDGMNPQDTFNLLTFAGDTRILFPQPVPATAENLRRAQKFLATREGSGGTEMMTAIRAALDPSDQQDHVRVVCFMTDGYVGNDMAIIGEIQKHPNARVFAFGIGQAVNRFLLDKMAEHGRGEVEYVGLNDDGSAAARRFHERVRNPLLTDLQIDWGGLAVADVYPQRLPDLFSAKPLILTGRYTQSGRGTIRLIGRQAGQVFTREIPVELPETAPQHDVLATLWARTRIDDLMGQDYGGMQNGNAREEVREAITQLGLEYRLMTQFTSFVAVEEMIITEGGQPRRIDVPVEMPEGVSRAGVFGEAERKQLSGQHLMRLSGSAGKMERPAERPSERALASNRAGLAVPSAPPPTLAIPAPTVIATDASQTKVSGGVLHDAATKWNQFDKLHPSIAAVIVRLQNHQTQASKDEAKFVRDGKAELQIWLVDKTAATLEELKKLGFEIVLNPSSSKLIIGRLPLERLAALAELAAVKYVAPQGN